MQSYARTCLLNPGPVTLTPTVRHALLGDDLCHREPEYSELQTEVRDRLAHVYEDAANEYTAVLLAGSGTAAVEAMVGSLVPHDGKALVVANGVYGERIAAMLELHEKPFDVVRSGFTEPMKLAQVRRRLDVDPAITHVVAVHHETTTGRLNEIAALGHLCRKRGVRLLLDTVSSFGGEWIDFQNWNIEACAATANKCLHGVPGMSFVLVRKAALESRRSGCRSMYLDLFRNYAEQAKGFPAFTPAVQVVYALREALRELEDQGGWQRRNQHYQHLSRVVRDGLARQGLRLLLASERYYSAILSSFELPEGVAFDDLYHDLKTHGFVIYPGQQALCGAIFRVAVMGDLTCQDMERFVRTFALVVERLRRQLSRSRPPDGTLPDGTMPDRTLHPITIH